jgi:hypothetical protein
MDENKPKSYINYFREAFTLSANIAFLSISAIGSLALLALNIRPEPFGPEVLALAAGSLEMLYLAVMPSVPRFIRAVNAKNHSEIQTIESEIQTTKTLQVLIPENVKKFIAFKQKKANTLKIMSEYKGNSDLMRETVQDKLTQLEVAYADALESQQRYNQLISQISDQELIAELKKIREEQIHATDKIKQVLERRIQLLEKRLDKYKQIVENNKVIGIQIQTLEDTLNYLMENALNPAQIEAFSDMVDQVIGETEIYQDSLKEVEGIFAQAENI